MKKTHYLILLILVFSLFVLLISCGKVDEPQENPNPIEDGGETEMVTIKFRVNGAVYDTKTIAKGSQVTPPETNPTPKNMEQYFAGWMGEDGLFDFSTGITEDLSLSAYFTDVYVVTFQDASGNVIGTTNVKYGKRIQESNLPTIPDAPEHMHFKGWTVEGEVISTANLLKSDIKTLFVAKATYETDTFYVRFYNQTSGETLSYSIHNYGDTIIAYTPEYGTISSYQISKVDYDFSQPVTRNLDIACDLKRDIYTVTFVDKEGVTITTKKAYAGTAVNLPESSDSFYSWNLSEALVIKQDTTIVLDKVSKSSYTEGFTPSLKTDIKEKEVSWSSNGASYYLNTEGQYFEYTGYFAGPIIANMNFGAQFYSENIVSKFKVTCDGVLVNEIVFGRFNALGSDATPITLCRVPAGEHTIRLELVETTFDENFLPVGANMNDFGIGVSCVTTTLDLSKVFYTVQFVNNTEDSVFADTEKGVVSTIKVMYGATPTLPTLPNELSTEEEFNGWWDEAGIIRFKAGEENPTYQDTIWYANYKMQKTYDVVFKDKEGNTLCVSNTLWGTNAKLPQSSEVYYVVKTEDIAKIYNVKGPAEVVVDTISKEGYASSPIEFTNGNYESETWTKYEMAYEGSMRDYGTMLYSVGQYVSFKGNFAGNFVVVFNADKIGHVYMARLYIDDVICWTSEMIQYDSVAGKWVGSGTVDTGVEIASGTHTIKLELVYADDSKAETKLQSWAALNCSLIIVSAKVEKEAAITPTKQQEYEGALALIEKQDYKNALLVLETLGDYSDAQSKVATCQNALYEQAGTIATTNPNEAYNLYSLLGDYLDAKTKASALRSGYISSLNLSSLKVGSTFKLGKYEQDGNLENGEEDITWIVLSIDGDKLFAISSISLDAMAYNDTLEDVSWENCTLRNFLNTSFLSSAFSSAEKSLLMQNDTNDLVSLLSEEESSLVAPASRKVDASTVAARKGIHGYSGNYWWWVKSTGESSLAPIVFHGGNVDPYGQNVDFAYFGVRPVITISLK